MKKTLAIVGYSLNNIETYFEQIKSLFFDEVNILKYCIDSSETKAGIEADVILVPSYDAFEKVKSYIKLPSEIVFGSRTVSEAGLERIKCIPDGTEVMLLDESIEMSKQMMAVLYQIGITNINLVPTFIGEIEKINHKTVIILGESSFMPVSAKEIINIGNSLLDVSTIIDIGIRLKLDHVLNNQNIRESYRKVVTTNIGLAEILGKTNRFQSSMDILLQVIDDGVIGINTDGEIFSYNNKAREIMGVDIGEMTGKNGIKLFPNIPFEKVIKNVESVKERLEKINGYDVVISVDPMVNSGKLYGAVAIIKRFSEEERKQHKIRAQIIGKGYRAKYRFKDIVGESEVIKKCKDIARRMANSNSSILITGETGTGKEMFAQAIHNSSNRKAFQFVAVNCGALPESLLESELFGYEEGAFTGARKGGKPGLFELAHKGTLFLDEIGEMPLNLQMRLLRVLQEREVMRLGGDRLINVDIRVIAATNKDLKEMVKSGKLREDLFYRLNVLPLAIPPLRNRNEDVLLLIKEFSKNFGCSFELTDGARKAFINHSWRGNVRELKNYIEYIINLGIKVVDVKDLPFEADNYSGKISYNKMESLVDDFIKVAGNDINKYIFVLRELKKGFENRERLGRRSISILARKSGIFASEQEIRRMLTELEKLSLVEVFPGRGGTVITETGNQILEQLRK